MGRGGIGERWGQGHLSLGERLAERGGDEGAETTREDLEQLSLFSLGALAFAQAAATLLVANIVLGRKVAFDLVWAVGIPTLLSIPCYFFGFRSLKLDGRPAKWPLKFAVSTALAALLLYACGFAILNIYGS